MRGRDVFVAGGANSAGQAAPHLAKWAKRVTLLIRGPSLAASMSDYLIRQIGAAPNIEVCYHVQVADGTGTATGHLQSLVLQDTASQARRTVPTGPDLPAGPHARRPHGRPPLPLETSLPGVFAAGDVRQGSVKRVASAVGEGAATIPLVHRYLQTSPAAPALRAGYPPHGPAHSAASTHPTTPPAVPHERAAAPKDRAAALP